MVAARFERAPASAAEAEEEARTESLTGGLALDSIDWSFLMDDAAPPPSLTTDKSGAEAEQSPEALEEASIEAAVAAGHLPPAFRTALCERWLATGHCAAMHQCNFAHSAKERRVEAAIKLGRLPAAFRTRFCASWALTGACARGQRCYYAHSADELRAKPQHAFL